MQEAASHPIFEPALVRARKRLGWTQQRVAEALNVDPNTYSRWERGVNQPSLIYRARLCTLFGCEPELLGLPADPPIPSLSHPPILPADPRLHDPGLPPAPPHLAGRATLSEQLTLRVCRGSFAGGLVVLCGLPGVGKTALARALAHNGYVRQYFEDGVLWAGLGPSPQMHRHLSHWGRVLGLSEEETRAQPDMPALALAVRNRLLTRRILLVLDDAWSLEAVLSLKVGGPHCAYLVTTRFVDLASQMAAQELVVVPELPVEESLHLLHYLCPKLEGSFPHLVEQVTLAAGGLPLALTLLGHALRQEAASRQTRRLQAALLRLLDARTRLTLSAPAELLEQGLSDDERRLASLSLRSVIALSEQRLSEEARAGLRALSVLPAKPSSFTEAAALAVMGGEAAVLDQLVDAGLLESQEQDRYCLHQTIADLARLHLSEQETRVQAAISERFLRYVRTLLEAHQSTPYPLLQERDLIRAAIERAGQLHQEETFIALVDAAQPCWLCGGEVTQAEQWLEEAMTAALHLNKPEHLSRLWRRAGELARYQGEMARASACFQEGMQQVSALPQAKELACELLVGWVEVECQRGHLQSARSGAQRAQRLAEQVERNDLLARLWITVGEVCYAQGDIQAAHAAIGSVLAFSSHLHREDLCLRALVGQGHLQADAGARPEAEQAYRQALTLARSLHDRQWIAATLIALCELGIGELLTFDAHFNLLPPTDQRALRRLARQLAEAGQQVNNTGSQSLRCHIQVLEGVLALLQHNLESAEAACSEAGMLALHLEQPLIASAAWLVLAAVYRAQQRTMEAWARVVQASSLTPAGHPLRGWADVMQAKVAAEQGNRQEARQAGEAAATTFEAIGFYLAPLVRRWVDALSQEALDEQEEALLSHLVQEHC